MNFRKTRRHSGQQWGTWATREILMADGATRGILMANGATRTFCQKLLSEFCEKHLRRRYFLLGEGISNEKDKQEGRSIRYAAVVQARVLDRSSPMSFPH
eukprot:GHVU01209940.1.p1 GENE.GHVU01209940.1~~GHVU01209940.1.p1  ORF type:complete len:100 (-),score=2.85 GHVU01209940.1:2-301(-)